MPPPPQPRPVGPASTPTWSQAGSIGAIDVNSHEDVLMLLVKLNLCMTACVLGALLFIIGGKVRRWRSAQSRRGIVRTDWDCASLGSQQPSLASVKKPGRGGRLWRSWREKLAASSARMFSEQSKKERGLHGDLSESDAPQPPPLVAAFRPASATIFHWSPAPARAMPMAAPPSLPPPPPLQPQSSVTSPTSTSHLQNQQLQHQQLQHSYYRSIGAGGCHRHHNRQGFPVTTDDDDEEAAAATSASSAASPHSPASPGAASSAASSAAALLACRCSNADLRLHNTPASSEFSLDNLLPPPPPPQALRSSRLQQQQLPPPLQPPQTPTSESVITDSSC